MKILVAGGAGFIGSNITDAYIESGHAVTVVDNLSSGREENLNAKAKFVRADITDAGKIKEIFAADKFDIVSLHAAQIDVRKSVADPAFDAGINIIGSLNVLENAKNHGVGKVIFASSGGTIYGECGKTPPDENSEARPLSPYGITKYSLEFYLKFYAAIYGMKYTILRYANVYGPRQDPNGEAGVVAIFSDKMLKGAELTIYGDGEQTRDYVFVGDLVKANVNALKSGDNEIINIGTSKATSVNELFRLMASVSGYTKQPVYKAARPGELLRSVLGIQKASKLFGWKPETEISKGLEKTVSFFKLKAQ